MQLTELARAGFDRDLSPQAVDRALARLGPKAEIDFDPMDFERTSQLVGIFARSVDGLDVRSAGEVERRMLRRLGARPDREKVVDVRSSLGVIALRNYVRAVSVYLGLDWEYGMQIQSAVSDLARYIAAQGEGTVSVCAPGDHVVVSARLRAPPTTPFDANVAELSALARLSERLRSFEDDDAVALEAHLRTRTAGDRP